jgi:hypothetical protein
VKAGIYIGPRGLSGLAQKQSHPHISAILYQEPQNPWTTVSLIRERSRPRRKLSGRILILHLYTQECERRGEGSDRVTSRRPSMRRTDDPIALAVSEGPGEAVL